MLSSPVVVSASKFGRGSCVRLFVMPEIPILIVYHIMFTTSSFSGMGCVGEKMGLVEFRAKKA